MKIGIIKEGKIPVDTRVALTPAQCAHIIKHTPVAVVVQRSPIRCYKDEEYEALGVPLVDDVYDCDVLLGVKEVPLADLIAHKTYFFFSHTIKKQPHNRRLLQDMIGKNITMIDYEVLTNTQGERLIAFGKFAGIVGAHNGLWAYGARTQQYNLPRMKDTHDYDAVIAFYKENITLPPMKIVLTGTGRVASGARQFLEDVGIKLVSEKAFLNETFDTPVFVQLDCSEYVATKDGSPYVREDFYAHPEKYKSIFYPYAQVADIMINGIYWDSRSPQFFTTQEMKRPDFAIKVIADVTCDIDPSSIPSTLFATTIDKPLYGYDPQTEATTEPHLPHVIDMMTIDNLPNELPRDASAFFGEQFMEHILAELQKGEQSDVLDRATLCENGDLTPAYEYLRDYVMAQSVG